MFRQGLPPARRPRFNPARSGSWIAFRSRIVGPSDPMTDRPTTVPEGDLAERVKERAERALRIGALRPIETGETWIEEDGVQFVVRRADNLIRKEAAARDAKERGGDPKPANPFLPYDQDLYVCDVSATHIALLNKFNVIDRHLLIVTRAFEHQETALTRSDFEALARCMWQYHSLGFYNSGRIAGASQPHKHLQLVPLPLSAKTPPVPMQPLIDAGKLPFPHELERFDPENARSVTDFAEAGYARYLRMLRRRSIAPVGGREAPWLAPAYNLLLTRDWMLLVPRNRETVEGLSINALGFAGSFFVKNDQDLAVIQSIGPLRVLAHVTSTEPDSGLD